MRADDPPEVQVRAARAACASVGRKREKLRKQQEELAEHTRIALQQARGVITVEDAASLVGITRATAYSVYLGENGDQS